MISKLKKSLNHFIHIESSSSLILGLATLMALFIANSNFVNTYQTVLNINFLGLTLSYWINDGLMAIFFFLVGLEIKKEIIIGELNSMKKAVFPFAAALGGMVVPALIFYFFNPQPPQRNGWGIPMATDIAFALGVLSLLGKRIPLFLKVLLLAVAIVDDLGAIIVIALFYTTKINILGFLFALVALIGIQIFKKLKISKYTYYIPLGVILWFGILYSGVHATIAGVILGLLTPIVFQNKQNITIKPVESLIKFLHTPVSFVIMPIFALANAGVTLSLSTFQSYMSTNLFNGIFMGLVFGKPIGILFFSYLSYKFKFASLPQGINWKHIFVLGNIAGIGFTMSLFISKLALNEDLEQIAKLAIIVASSVAVLIGFVSILIFCKKEKS